MTYFSFRVRTTGILGTFGNCPASPHVVCSVAIEQTWETAERLVKSLNNVLRPTA